MAKTKKISQNPRKIMQDQINEIGGATSSIIGELREVNNHLIGLETLVLNLAEFFEKKEEFIEFVEGKIKELEKEKEKTNKKK